MQLTVTGHTAAGDGDARELDIYLNDFKALVPGTFPCKPAGAADPRGRLQLTDTTKLTSLAATTANGDCSITLVTLDQAGGHFAGTFSATMVGQGPTTSMFTNGSFDVTSK